VDKVDFVPAPRGRFPFWSFLVFFLFFKVPLSGMSLRPEAEYEV
jgi:hypothetical protein